MTSIKDKLESAHQRIAQAAEKASRDKKEIALLAVSKTKPITDIIEAYQAGHRRFGENYVQEAEEKITALKTKYPDIEWHFIGPLQSNKTKLASQLFDWVHTIDRAKIAHRLNDQRLHHLPPLNVCIQVNIGHEKTKSGVLEHEVMPLAAEINKLKHITLRGLMAIPSTHVSETQSQAELSQLHSLFSELQKTYASVDTLSVGMSQDLERAINHGSTLVRVGSAIFGARDKKAIDK